ncbi:hypothetical protein ACJRO7_032727 [Eucalyptus globulus]|uniref:LRAT domain-containing protein n=1 Tax=Eucalyptus globulus TaxID=34317 RepID=A0ABD3JX25_EUCGL
METRKKIKGKIKDGMELLWKKVDPEDLKPGDHIYSYRLYGLYTHHGIYEGGSYVIHFTNPKIMEAILSFSGGEPETMPACPKCGYQKNTDRGVIRTCLDCFRQHGKKLHSIYNFNYGAPRWCYRLKRTCSTLSCDKSPEQVIEVASNLLGSDRFGTYHVFTNNCEHFATYCKTGVCFSKQAEFVKHLRKVEERFKKFVETLYPTQ